MFGVAERRELEMHVRIKKPDGRSSCTVAERDLEPYGWGLDPVRSVERYRAARDQEAKQDGRESWGDTAIVVVSDTEQGYPVKGYRLKAEIGVCTTRPQEALRMIGQFLIDVANGVEQQDGLYGEGLELIEEELDAPANH